MTSSSPKIEQFMLLSKQNAELQKIVGSQSQQINIFYEQIEELKISNEKLMNENDELKVKCEAYRSTEQKISIIKEALGRDFIKLKQKMQQNVLQNVQFETKLADMRQIVDKKQQEINVLLLQIHHLNREISRLHSHLEMFKKQNENQRFQLHDLKLENIDNILSVQKTKRVKQHNCDIRNLSSKKTVKGKAKGWLNESCVCVKKRGNVSFC